MKVPQVSVFLENRRGRLHEASEVLAKAGINLITLALADTADFGVMRFIVNDPAKAVRILKDNGFTAIINDVLAIEVTYSGGAQIRSTQNNANEVSIEIAFVRCSIAACTSPPSER